MMWKIPFLPIIVVTGSDCLTGTASVMIYFPYERVYRQLLINWRIPQFLSRKQTVNPRHQSDFYIHKSNTFLFYDKFYISVRTKAFCTARLI